MKFKFTWAHGIILALVSFIVFICSMVFSLEFSENTFDLVSDDYYQDEIYYQKEIDAANNAMNLLEKPQIFVDKEVGIEIQFPKEFSSINTMGRFQLYRPNSKMLDINKNTLDFEMGNKIIIPKKVLEIGNYILKLYWEKNNINYKMEIPVEWK